MPTYPSTLSLTLSGFFGAAADINGARTLTVILPDISSDRSYELRGISIPSAGVTVDFLADMFSSGEKRVYVYNTSTGNYYEFVKDAGSTSFTSFSEFIDDFSQYYHFECGYTVAGGSASGGNFTITLRDGGTTHTTGSIAWNASAATVKTALLLLPCFTADHRITVTVLSATATDRRYHVAVGAESTGFTFRMDAMDTTGVTHTGAITDVVISITPDLGMPDEEVATFEDPQYPVTVLLRAGSPLEQSVSQTLTLSVTDYENLKTPEPPVSTIVFSGSGSTLVPYHISGDNEIIFTQSVHCNFNIGLAFSTLTFTDLAIGTGPYHVSANNTITFSDSVIVGAPRRESADSTITFTDVAYGHGPIPISASTTITFSDSLAFAGPKIGVASTTITFTDSHNEVYAIDIETDIIFSDSALARLPMIYQDASSDITFTDSSDYAGPKYGDASSDLTLTDEVSLPGSVYSRMLVECIYFEDRGYRSVTASASSTITFTDSGLRVHWEQVDTTLTFVDEYEILGLDFESLVCGLYDDDGEKIVQLNSPGAESTITFTDSVVVYGGHSLSLTETITFSVSTTGLVIRIRR